MGASSHTAPRDPRSTLSEVFGFASFRGQQEEVVRHVAAGGDALVLMVRSVVVPQEWNALLNVRHPDMARVIVRGSDPFRLDPRLVTNGAS